MPKVLFFSDPSNGRPGLGATIRLDSGEPCYMSIAPGWIRVKKSRFGLFGPTLYNVRDVRKTYETAKALALLFPDSLLPPGFTDPVLSAFANAILHCPTCDEVAFVLGEAIARADSKIVNDFAAFLGETTTRVDCFYDVNVLPHPKEAIIAAIEREIVRSPLEGYVDSLRTGAAWLWNFLDGIGPAPLPLSGVDLSQLPRGITAADPDKLAAELKRVFDSPNRRIDEERAKHFEAIADREGKQIEERIVAAVRIRGHLASAATSYIPADRKGRS